MVQVPNTADRLARLRALRHQIDTEIADLEARDERVARIRRPPRIPKPPPAKPRGQSRLEQLGVTALEVKEWAFAEGLIFTIRRGRVSGDLIEQYAATHPHQEAGPA